MAETTQPRTYPLNVPNDPRFTIGLLIDVKRVLEEHGYPPITHGLDLVDLQQALHSFLYKRASDA
jgi:hypothetical protein